MDEIRMVELYDIAFDLMHLTVSDEFEYGQTVTVKQGIHIDFDRDGKPASIELIRASKHFGMLPKFFTSQKRDGTITISKDHIIFRMNIHYRDDVRSFERQISNDYDICPGEFEFSNY